MKEIAAQTSPNDACYMFAYMQPGEACFSLEALRG